MRRRSAFTITEMLVALALIMLIMAVMAEAFTAGLNTFRDLKAVGDMDQKMRAAIIVMCRDLTEDHFNGVSPNQLLSTCQLPPQDSNGNPSGFFVASGTSSSEGSDADGNPSWVSTTGLLHFTINRRVNWGITGNTMKGDRRESYLSANVPGTALTSLSRFMDGQNYYSQTAEVAYFLRPNGDTTTGPNPQTRFTLFRRQAVMLTQVNSTGTSDATTMNNSGQAGNTSTYCDVSWSPSTSKFNNWSDVVTAGNRRLLTGGSYGAANSIPTYGMVNGVAGENATLAGNDILLTDILSFSVRIFPVSPTLSTVQFQDPGLYDTSSATFNVKAIQIILRVWDPKTQTARQITVVQDM